jgi:cytochrome P450
MSSLPAPSVARLPSAPDPYPEYAALRDTATYHDGRGWVVVRPAAVAPALAHGDLSVRVPRVGAGPAATLLAAMARFTEGATHAQARRAVTEVIESIDGQRVRAVAAERARVALDGSRGAVDAGDLARQVTTEALALALGLTPPQAAATVDDVAVLCRAAAPGAGPRPADDADAAAHALVTRCSAAGSSDRVVAMVSVLFQAHDAVAALVGNCLVARIRNGTGAGDVNRLVRTTLVEDPPVHATRRWADTTLELDGATITPGDEVTIVLATDATDRVPPATFGSGPHACPGHELALALATGFLTGVRDANWRPVQTPGWDHEPRPNLRLPRGLVLTTAGTGD